SSSIVMLMSVISTHYDLSRISVGHYKELIGSELLLHCKEDGQEFVVKCKASEDFLNVNFVSVKIEESNLHFFNSFSKQRIKTKKE
ncbi:hypothetical protein, partial [Escherichia coli]|uniref:hypothetical protein n=1 Tax=Escherichia coli TaxID=562 RepID=UPI000B9EF471